jgi:hypothetical protein
MMAYIGNNNFCGFFNFTKLSKVIDALVEGTLVTEVRMKLIRIGATNTITPAFVPENPLCKNILRKFLDEESVNVLFEVGSENERGKGGGKRARTIYGSLFMHTI